MCGLDLNTKDSQGHACGNLVINSCCCLIKAEDATSVQLRYIYTDILLWNIAGYKIQNSIREWIGLFFVYLI